MVKYVTVNKTGKTWFSMHDRLTDAICTVLEDQSRMTYRVEKWHYAELPDGTHCGPMKFPAWWPKTGIDL